MTACLLYTSPPAFRAERAGLQRCPALAGAGGRGCRRDRCARPCRVLLQPRSACHAGAARRGGRNGDADRLPLLAGAHLRRHDVPGLTQYGSTEEKVMYQQIGKKIKTLAVVLAVIGMVFCVIWGF